MAEIIKRIGPANCWCRRCAHCESVELGCMDDVPIYICTDPYDCVEKRIPGNENITCTMFNLANEVPVFKATKVNSVEEKLKELIKASKRKDELIQSYREKLKGKDNEINLLNSKLDKLGEYYRTDEKLIDNIQKVIFPQEEGSDYTYSYDEILEKVKDLKVQSDENGTMYEEIKELREKVARRNQWVEDLRSDVDTLQNECLVIADIAKRAYDGTNRD